MLPAFEVFGLSIPMYGVMTMCGMLAAFILLSYTRRFVRFTEDQMLSCALWAIFLGFVGAKLLYWLVEIKQILANPHYLIETLREGFVFYGALIGGLLGVGVYAAKKKLPFFAFVDLFAPSLSLAHAFGRIGCFCAGCCYGVECDCAISVTFPEGAIAPAGVPRLPTQLMESAFLFLLTLVLVLILRRKKAFGTVTSWYLILYGVWRFGIEFIRGDERGMIGVLSTSQFISIFAVLAGAALLILLHTGVLKSPAIPEPAEEPAAKKGKEPTNLPAGEEKKPDEPEQQETKGPEESADTPEQKDGQA